MKTFKTFAFGCRVNQAEEEEMQKRMIQSGFSWDEKNPDIFIVNTCAVTEKAEREARQLIYTIKRELPKTLLVVTGCALTNWQKDSLLGKLPIDFPVDNLNKEYLVELIDKRMKSERLGKGKEASSDFPTTSRDWPPNHSPSLTPQNKYISSGRYLLKIQDGCHRFCTFCIVPYLRGLPKSSTISSIVDKINNLPKHIKEVVLTAINTEAFSKETGETFIDLVKAVFEKSKIERLSFGSIHPWSINEDFFSFYQNEVRSREGNNSGRLVDFFHIPLQSGSDKILQLMKRNYKRKEIEEKLFEIQKINPYALIGTDIIVGFLEETDKDFADTYAFLRKVPINKFHVFRFSKKRKTAAYYLAKRLKEPGANKKQKRSKALIQLSKLKFATFQQSLVGQAFSCLTLHSRQENYQEALLSNQVPILIKTSKDIPSQSKTVLVKRLYKKTLIGEII